MTKLTDQQKIEIIRRYGRNVATVAEAEAEAAQIMICTGCGYEATGGDCCRLPWAKLESLADFWKSTQKD